MNTSPTDRQQLERLYQTLLQQFENFKSSELFQRLDADLLRDSLRELYRALDHVQPESKPNAVELPELTAPVNFSPAVSIKPAEPEIPAPLQEVQFKNELPEPVMPVSVQEIQEQPVLPEQVKEETVFHEPVRSDLQEARKTVYTETIVKAAQSGPTIGSSYTAVESLSDRISQNGQPTRLSEQLQSKPLEDLRLSIGLNERFAFINSLFEGNQQSFYSAVDRLNNSSSYPDAQKELDKLQSDYGWDNSNHRFAELSELVKRRFGV